MVLIDSFNWWPHAMRRFCGRISCSRTATCVRGVPASCSWFNNERFQLFLIHFCIIFMVNFSKIYNDTFIDRNREPSWIVSTIQMEDLRRWPGESLAPLLFYCVGMEGVLFGCLHWLNYKRFISYSGVLFGECMVWGALSGPHDGHACIVWG